MIALIFSECSDGSRPNKMWLKSFMKVMLNRNNNSERALVEANRKLVEANRESTARMEAKLAVKVVDLFGNDTMTIVDVSVGKNGGKK